MLLIKLVTFLLTSPPHSANEIFEPQFINYDVPPCRYHIKVDSQAGTFVHRVGGCYSYHLCRNYHPMPHFETCEFDPRTLEYTVCCPKLPRNKFDYRKESRIWEAQEGFECGVRLENKAMVDEFNRKVSPDSQIDILLKALLIEASRSGTHPWMALVMVHNQPVCGASIISRQSVLTSAHCLIKSTNMNDYSIIMGSVNLGQGIRRRIRTINVHPSYREGFAYFDIALITLDDALQFDWTVNAICLAKTRAKENMLFMQNATVIGFGRTHLNGPMASTLREAQLKIIKISECRKFYRNIKKLPHGLTDEFLCAVNERIGIDTCGGDSGGPLSINYYTKTLQIGIITLGLGCGIKGIPAVFTSISYHYDWVQETIKKSEESRTIRPAKSRRL